MNKAVFFDRDGTINHDPGYLGDPDLVELYPAIGEVIGRLKNEHSFKIIVISNQSGISRKLITENEVNAVNQKINSLVKDFGAEIDEFYYCPFLPEIDGEEKSMCRKPSPLMVFQAAKEHNIDLSNSFFIGDKSIDVLCGKNAGVETILFLNGKNGDQINILQKQNKTPNFVADNFFDIYNYIVEKQAEKID